MLMTHLSFASSSMAATTSDNVARTVSASNASNSSSLTSSQSATAVHSSSLSSLFERVTNFRRSLIKNQARSKHKSATRPVSGTFSFFNGKALQEQNSSLTQNSASSTSLMLEQFENAAPDDAIYGFTAGSTASLRLRMQRLNLSMSSQSSPPLSSVSSTTPSLPPLQVYETIDETKQKVSQQQQLPHKMMMDPTRPLPALPTQQSPQQQSTQLLSNKSSPAKSTSYLRAKQSSNAMSNRHQNRYYTSGATSASILPNSCPINSNDDDWKRNRRSSAIIFGTDFSTDLIDHDDSLAPIGGQKLFAHLNRSSDDLLFASRSQGTHVDHKGIYENLRSSRSKVTSGIREDRKLTKDSGYESASTLVNVGMQNHAGLLKSAPNGFCVKTQTIEPHSRSESIDSNNSLDLYQSVETRTFDSAFHVRTTDGDSVENDSPPPTPPIRFSSLEQNRVNNNHQNASTNLSMSCGRVAQHVSHSHTHQHLKQDSIVSFVSSRSGGSQASSHSSTSNSLSSSNGSSAFMQSNPVINYNHFSHGRSFQFSLAQQNSEFIPSQPVNYRMVDVLPSSPPPPLPPKNKQLISTTVSHKNDKNSAVVNDIKAIQKKAVYEFYLRQKEKKLKEKEFGSSKLMPSSPPSTVDYSERFDLPPPPLEISKWTTEEEEEEFPSPPTPLDDSIEILLPPEPEFVPNSSVLSPPDLVESCDQTDKNLNSPQIYRGVDLSSIWSNIDFSPLLKLSSPVKESELEDDEDEVDEELVDIERAHKSQLEADWQKAQLESIQNAAETEMLSNEHKHASLFQLEHGSKLESLCADVTMITRLLVSIVGQLTQHSFSDHSDKTQNKVQTSDDKIEKDSIENTSRRTRLLGQLEDAKRLRDNIDTRRTMLVARFERRSHSSCPNTDLNATTTVAGNDSSTKLASELANYLTTRERTLVLTEFVKLLSNTTTGNLNSM